MAWKDHNNKTVDLAEFLAKYKGQGRKPFIGTDSKTIGNKTRFTTVFVYYLEGRGGVYIDHTVKEDRPKSLYQKLFKETWYSIETALEVMEIDPSITPEVLEVHIDVNDNPKHSSGRYRGELMGLVLGQGFKCESKPNSWAATTLADKISRNPNKLFINRKSKRKRRR
jgi:predicted RNase H-related nuclease YkuK (DUF458 family)